MAESVRWDAVSYEEVSSVQLGWGRKLVASRRWRGDEVVLDAGCGTGRLAEEILARLPRGRIIAVDLDPAMVEEAKKRLGPHGARAKVIEADLRDLPEFEPVDVIFSNAVLHWIPDHDDLFAGFVRHLKPGGRLLIQCGGEGNLAHVRAIASEVQKLPAFAAHFATWQSPWRYEDDASTEERLFIAGYVHADVTLTAAPTRFPDRPTYEKFVRTVILNPYLQALPSAPLREEFVRAFLQRVATSGLGWSLDYVRLTIHAQRPPHA